MGDDCSFLSLPSPDHESMIHSLIFFSLMETELKRNSSLAILKRIINLCFFLNPPFSSNYIHLLNQIDKSMIILVFSVIYNLMIDKLNGFFFYVLFWPRYNHHQHVFVFVLNNNNKKRTSKTNTNKHKSIEMINEMKITVLFNKQTTTIL